MDLIIIDEIPAELDKKEILKNFIDNKNLSIEFQYNSNFNNTKALREFIEASFSLFGVKDIWKSRFILISDELNNNAIEYGSLDEEKNKLILDMKTNSEGIYVNLEVIDTGNGKSSKKAENMYNLGKNKLDAGFDNHSGIRGRGLFQIIHKIVDELYFKDSLEGGLIVGIRKELKNGLDIN